MQTILLLLALGTYAPNAARPPANEPRTLQCTATNTASGKDRKCSIKLPKGMTFRACDASEKAGGRCALDARMVAWTEGVKGAQCELQKKKTDWKSRVGIKVSKKTKPGGGSCTLFVSVQ